MLSNSRLLQGTTLSLLVLSLPATAGFRHVEIPEQSGFSGYLSAAAKVSRVASNTVSGPSYKNVTSRRIDSLNEAPDETTIGSLSPNFDLRYTFGERRVQLVAGNLLEDAVRYDFSHLLGVRWQPGRLGVLNGGLTFGSNRVYYDPYKDDGSRRGDTTQDKSGVRLAWEWIGETPVTVLFSYRYFDIDTERSGRYLLETSDPRLQDNEKSDLERSGGDWRLAARYTFAVGSEVELEPEASYTFADRDGDAISGQRGTLALNAAWFAESFQLFGSASVGYYLADHQHPVYDNDSNALEWGLGARFVKPDLFDVDDLSWYTTAGYARSDNDNRFLTMELWTAGLGILWRFGR